MKAQMPRANITWLIAVGVRPRTWTRYNGRKLKPVISHDTMKMLTNEQTSTFLTLSISNRFRCLMAWPSAPASQRAGSLTHSQMARAQSRPGMPER